MKNNPIISQISLVVIYAIAFVIGFLVFNLMEGNLLLRILVMDVVATVVLFLFSTLFKNASIYGPYWSVFPIVISIFLMIHLKSYNIITYITVALVILWGVRLTFNCLFRFKNLNNVDWRYEHFRVKHPKIWPLINLTGIHLFPTIVVYLCMMPVFSLINARAIGYGAFNLSSILGILIAFAGIMLELICDSQLHYYKKKFPNQLIKFGLRKNSRHPNYLGEILFWFGIFLFMLSLMEQLWILALGPIVNLLMFSFISIPLMDKHMLENFPEYKEYMEKTNPLIPLKK